MSWSVHKSRLPVKSFTSVETLAAGEAIDEGKVLVKALEELLGSEVNLCVVLGSKDLFSNLSTCTMTFRRSTRGDAGSIKYQFAIKSVSAMIWVPRNINLAHPATKNHSH